MQTLRLREVVEQLSELLVDGKDKANLQKVEAVMASYNESFNCWKRYEHFDTNCRYTRNLIAQGEDLSWALMLLCWNPKRESPIHSHSSSECYVRVLHGTITEYRYAWPAPGASEEEPLKCIGTSVAAAGDVTFMNDNLGLHKLVNDSDEPAITLHLYFPGFQSCKLFMDNNGKQSTSFMCFHTENGRKVERDL